jgi:hypothetical protein
VVAVLVVAVQHRLLQELQAQVAEAEAVLKFPVLDIIREQVDLDLWVLLT